MSYRFEFSVRKAASKQLAPGVHPKQQRCERMA
jgi:hypothetical protein